MFYDLGMYEKLLTQIKNAQAVKKESLKVPYSKKSEKILEILNSGGYVGDFEKKGRGIKKIIFIKLKYNDSRPAISGTKFISKSSRRIYIGYKDIRPVRSNYGLLAVSTSKGIMTGREAKKMKLGGEALFEIW